MSVETIQKETIYSGKAFNVIQETVRLPHGRTATLDIVEHCGAVTILPLDEDGQIWFIRQYRHPTRQFLLELPAGMVEKNEAPEVCAGREIQEEIGMAARSLSKIGEFFLAPGYSTEYMYIYLATGLTPSQLPGDEDEVLSVEKIPVELAFQKAINGEIKDAKSLASLLFAQPFLKQAMNF